jgi:hypothetical protein
MKKIIAFFKSLFTAPSEEKVSVEHYAELKKELVTVNEAQASAPVVEEKAPKASKKVVVSEVIEAAPKKKKRYYKPKNKA